MGRVIIVGGGLAGLAAAFRLQGRHEVVLIEACARLGGQIHTELSHGFVIERGAEGFVARSQAVPALASDLGMPESELIAQSVMRSYGFDGQRLIALQAGEAASFLGFQVAAEDLGKGIRSFRRGMGSLISALEGNLHNRITLLRGVQASHVETGASGVRVTIDGGRVLEADALIVATSAAAASSLLTPVAGELATALQAARTLSSVTVELAYERDAIEHPLDGTGFVVATDHQQEGLRACAFTSAKFADRAPPGRVSLRLFFRPSSEQFVNARDAHLVERAVFGLRRVLAVRGEPLHAWVSRWPNALPVFDDAHRARVVALETRLHERAVYLAGSAFHGAGIDAAVSSGERAASICGAAVAA